MSIDPITLPLRPARAGVIPFDYAKNVVQGAPSRPRGSDSFRKILGWVDDISVPPARE